MNEVAISRSAGNPWLVCRRPRPGAIGLFCFPHGGGSAGEFARWAGELPDVEIRAVQLPGRGSRIDDPAFTTMGSLVGEVLAQIDFHGRFAFFGHSLGALVAYEVARGLRNSGRKQPERLFLSAFPAPHLPRDLPAVHHLGDQELLAAVAEMYETLPTTLNEDPELLRLMMASHRADFAILETYRHLPGDPLEVPLHLIGGTKDRITTEQMEAWAAHSNGPTDLRWLPGGHFYLRQQRIALLSQVRSHLVQTNHGALGQQRPGASPGTDSVGQVSDPPALPGQSAVPRTQGAQGFLSELQAGRFRWDLISPLPGQDEEDRRCGDVAVAEMTAFLKQFVDPARVEATGRLPEDFVQQCAARGYLSMRHPVEEGGLGLSALNAFRLVQTAASWSTAAALTLALHLGSGARACLPLLGDGEVSRDVLRACAEGVGFGDAGTEPSGAADTTRDCTADPVQGGFLLSGEKIFAQNASSAGFLLVSATVRGSGAEDPALFLVDTSAPGFAVISCHDFVGFKGADNGAIRLDRVFVPRSRMLSGPCPQDPAVPSRLSPRALRAIAARGRMYPVAAPAMAIGQLGVHWSRQFVRRRSIDGLPLGAFDEIQRLLAASLADVFVMESVVEWCLLAEERHPGIDVIPEMTAAKNITSRACWRIIDRTLSIAATEGLETASSKNRRGVQPLPVERLFRDARGLRIAGGADFLVDHRAARAMLSDLYATRSSADRTRPTAATGNVVGGQLTARNQAHLDYVARQASAFAEVCSALVAAHPDPEELFARQRTLILLSCISGEMFGMAASLARAARMTAEGHPDAQLLADVFCEEARHRIDDALRRLRTAREANHARACHAWLNGDELAFLSRDTITDPPSGPH